MKRSKGMTRGKGLALMAMLYGAMLTIMLLPAYGQEVDPTWYDPWAAPNTAVVHTPQPPVAIHRHTATLKRVLATRNSQKHQAKRTTTTAAVITPLMK